jgi:hypothetical protein
MPSRWALFGREGQIGRISKVGPLSASLPGGAFQLSLGRSTDFDLAKLAFRDPNVETGKQLFHQARSAVATVAS